MFITPAIIQTAFEVGLIYSLVALSLYLSFSILNLCDLSTDGCYTLGCAVGAMVTIAGHPVLALFAAMFAGVCSGFITAFLQTRLGVESILSGIIVNTGLYTINLFVMGLSSNISIFGTDTIFSLFKGLSTSEFWVNWHKLILIVIIVIIACALMAIFLNTKLGLSIRATGDNEVMVTSLAKDSGKVKIVGLMIANGLVAVAGSVLCQQQRYFEISMGTGMLVMGIASVIIGMALFGKIPVIKPTLVVIFGAIVYKACLSLAINMGINPNNLKLLMTIIFLIALISRRAMDGKGGSVK